MADSATLASYPTAPPTRPFRLRTAEIVQARPGEGFARSDWDCWTFEYILSGHGRFEIDDMTYTLGPGDMYILPKGLAHGYWADEREPWRKSFFVVDGPLISHLLAAYGLNGVHYVANCEAESWFDALHSLKRSGDRHMDDRATILFHELLIHLSTVTKVEGPVYSAAVKKALAHVHRSIEHPISMEDIAQASERSKSHLSRIFLHEVGITPYEYLIRLRMDLARTLLSMTPFSITEIAQRLCYADAYYFSNAFKQREGMSPQAYRRQESGDNSFNRRD